MPSYSRDSWHREPIYVTIFLAQRSPERFGTVLQTSRTVRKGSADLNFARRYFSTASKPPKKRSRAVPPVSHFQNLFVHGRRGPFQNLNCLENCSVESFLTKSYNCVVCIEMYPFESIACVESSLLMVLVFVYFFQTLCVKVK